MHSQHGLTPRLKPLSARRSTILSVLDIGTSKVVCLIAELQPAEALSTLRGRTHLARIIGIGHQRSLGLKGGAIVDLEAAENSIRQDGWGARGRMKDGSSTDITVHNGVALSSFWQCGELYRLDPTTLETLGKSTWHGDFPSTGVSAHPKVDERTGRIIAIAVEDNLVKGAAGQAVQSFNIVHGLPEAAGLEQHPLVP